MSHSDYDAHNPAEKQKQAVALSSVAAGLVLTLLKLVVGVLTGSLGIISEAAHSGLDLGAAFVTYLAVRISDRPADRTHPYGHGKVESVSALIETGLLLVTCAWVAYEALHRLLFKRVEIEATWYAFVVMGVSILIDLSRSRALRRVAQETHSQALEADALHFQSDILSSAMVLVGLAFVALGVWWADALAGLGVAVLVVVASLRLGKRTIDVLIDTAPQGLTERILAVTPEVEGVEAVDRVRVRRAGPSVFIDMVVTVGRTVPLEQAHRITEAVEARVREAIPDADVMVHVEPVAKRDETVPERIQTIAANQGLAVHDVRVHSADGAKSVSLDVEVDHRLTLGQAHALASHLEDSIRDELGASTEVNTHIEPVEAAPQPTGDMTPEEMRRIQETIDDVAASIPLLRDVHQVVVRRIDGKVFITMHCVFDDQLALDDAHRLSSRVEYLIKERLPNVEHVLVHVEPVHRGKLPTPNDQ